MHLDSTDWHASQDAQRERLSAWLDGALPVEERAALDAHLASCAACQREVNSLRQVRALLRALPDSTPPRSFLLPLEGELATAAAAPETPPATVPHIERPAGMQIVERRWPRRAQRFGGLAAALGLALLGTSALLGGHHGGTSSTASTAANAPATTSYAPSRSATGTPGASARLPADGTNQQADAGATSGAPPQQNPISSATPGPTASEETPPFVPLAGGGLLASGLILLVGGSVADRRTPGR
jgi:anti-sigma factor RsiW